MTLSGYDGLFRVFNLVWCLCLNGDVSTGWTRAAGYLFSENFCFVVVDCSGGGWVFYICPLML